MKFNERLKSLRQSRSLTQAQVSQIVGLGRSTIASYELGVREPDFDTLKLFADYYHVTVDYILGNTSLENKANESIFSKYRGDKEYFKIPVLGTVVSDTLADTNENIEEYEEIPASRGDPRDYFAMHIHGQSLEPRLMDGDTVIVKKQEKFTSGQVAVVLIGNERTVKRIRQSEKGILLTEFNQDIDMPLFYTNEEIQQLSIRIAGIVVESRHKWA